jgi:hypothetical protein
VNESGRIALPVLLKIVVVGRHRRQFVDGLIIPGAPWHLGLAQAERDGGFRGGGVEFGIGARQRPAQVVEDSAEAGVMQGVDERRPHRLDQAHERPGFGQRPIELEGLVVDGGENKKSETSMVLKQYIALIEKNNKTLCKEIEDYRKTITEYPDIS